MKTLVLLSVLFSLVSCNTAIGVWRDTKATYHWSKKKIQESQNNSGGSDVDYEYGAPVY
jgi:predicted small secreted protein